MIYNNLQNIDKILTYHLLIIYEQLWISSSLTNHL